MSPWLWGLAIWLLFNALVFLVMLGNADRDE